MRGNRLPKYVYKEFKPWFRCVMPLSQIDIHTVKKKRKKRAIYGKNMTSVVTRPLQYITLD